MNSGNNLELRREIPGRKSYPMKQNAIVEKIVALLPHFQLCQISPRSLSSVCNLAKEWTCDLSLQRRQQIDFSSCGSFNPVFVSTLCLNVKVNSCIPTWHVSSSTFVAHIDIDTSVLHDQNRETNSR